LEGQAVIVGGIGEKKRTVVVGSEFSSEQGDVVDADNFYYYIDHG